MTKKRLAGFMAMVFCVVLVLAGCPQDSSAKPRLTGVTPNKIAAGSPDTQLHLTGMGFSPPATVIWNNTSALPTQYLDSKDLEATVPANLLEAAGTATIFAQVGQNQIATQSLSITISSGTPTLTGVAPAHIIVGQPGFTMALTGTGFNSSSIVKWDTTALPTSLVSDTQLTAAVPQSVFSTPETAKITVTNSAPGGGGATSGSVNFTVVAQLVITTTTLPAGSLGTAYTATLTATGGVAPYKWSVTTGALPAGLTLNTTTGVITGTPTAAGAASFTVQVVDSTGTLARRVIR